jgi:hypothetical protein
MRPGQQLPGGCKPYSRSRLEWRSGTRLVCRCMELCEVVHLVRQEGHSQTVAAHLAESGVVAAVPPQADPKLQMT